MVLGQGTRSCVLQLRPGAAKSKRGRDVTHFTSVNIFHLFAPFGKCFKNMSLKKNYLSSFYFFPSVKRKLKEEWEEQQRKEREEEQQKLQEKKEREVIPVTGG